MEAAFLLPTFLTLVLLALQPVCLLYTQAVMESAAAQTARLMITTDAASDDACRAFALRRLAAVPDVSVFHAGGPLSWDVELTRAETTGGQVGVKIAGTVRPLPVIGAFVRAFGDTNALGDVRLEVSVEYEGRPVWLEGDYATWIAIWED